MRLLEIFVPIAIGDKLQRLAVVSGVRGKFRYRLASLDVCGN